ncbi:hypothetical protein GCL60_16455 [Silvanigrella paludirubra]|uniref:Uncharacterized protein n=1 Tax=Silvanigrella paludirubra TaxID=2499159 RepID=A0A6N6VQ89_9BACT|nr:hypothetical protein [Silvanigrella paludirubra]KAB8035820.1 hypothetical protein GCL60_16455 [Silvanigrella paludirubra]
MDDQILVTESEIENVKKEFEGYVNKIAEVSNYLNNELEASFVLLSAARKNIDLIKAKYELDFPIASEVYRNLSLQVIDFENEIAAHLSVGKK